MNKSVEKPLKKRGPKPIPEALRRVHLTVTVAPDTLATLGEIAAKMPGDNIGRVLDRLAAGN